MFDARTSAEYRYRVVTVDEVTPAIRELWLAPSVGVLPYQAGQYVLLGDPAHQVPQRSYSVANAPRADGRVSVLVTRFPEGPTSGWMHNILKPGDEVALDGPYGSFVRGDDRDRPVLLLAAGSGLAPIRALAEALLADDRARKVTLFFSVRSAADTIEHARFQEWTRTYPGFRYLLTLTRDPTAALHRRIPELLTDTLGSLQGWEIFVAGPSGFVTACAAAARALGAAATAVHTEEFFADPEPWTEVPPAAPEPSVCL
ncbi:MAG: FAD-binding oxidoreductase [Microbacteriaceae bacterium]